MCQQVLDHEKRPESQEKYSYHFHPNNRMVCLDTGHYFPEAKNRISERKHYCVYRELDSVPLWLFILSFLCELLFPRVDHIFCFGSQTEIQGF